MKRQWNKVVAHVLICCMVVVSLQWFSSSTPVNAEGSIEVQAGAGDIPADTLRIHYQRADNSFNHMGLWLWGGVATPSEAVGSWPVGATSFKEEQKTSYGAYVDIKLNDESNKVYFLVIDKTNGDKEADQKEVSLFTPELNEVWIKEGSDEVFLWEPVNLPENTIRIHYKKTDQNYSDWGLWLWDDVKTPSDAVGSWPTGASAFSESQVGRNGAYVDVLLKENAEKISFLIINRTDGTKDGAERSFIMLDDYNQLFLNEGSPAVYTSPYVVEAGESTVNHPEWSKDSTIYEVNVRQYTDEGTFKAFEAHIPRLKDLGVEILWLMPIHPISEEKRAGTLGSYYAVADYKAVNPEFGSLQDFKDLVEKAHNMGFKVVLDWVANHTGWDNEWIKNKAWYNTDDEGNIVSPNGWLDTADLNFKNADMRAAMIDAMKFWVTEADIDGYRSDYAAGVPQDFWDTARKELDAIKPMYMLAEDNTQFNLLKEAFNSNYGWDLFYNVMLGIPGGGKGVKDIQAYIKQMKQLYPKGSYPMNFITNHDTNSWEGTTKEMFGESEKAMAALMFTMPGMPLIYSGQEAGLDKRLLFFEKDQIDWSNQSLKPLYEQFIRMKKENQALWNGSFGGEVKFLNSTDPRILAFERETNGNKVISIINLSAEKVETVVNMDGSVGSYHSYFANSPFEFNQEQSFNLAPWEFHIFSNAAIENEVPKPDPKPGDSSGNTGNISVPGLGEETEGVQTFNEDDLKKLSGDNVLIVKNDAKQILLPIQAGDLTGNKQIRIQFNKVSVELPAEVLKVAQASAVGQSADETKIALKIVPVEKSEVDSLLKSVNQTNTSIKMNGNMYDFALSIITDNKEINKLITFTKPVTLAFTVEGQVDRDLSGVFFVENHNQIQYAGGDWNKNMIFAKVMHFSRYAVLEVDNTFSDVNSSNWASPAIKSLAAKQIINGTTKMLFEPDRSVTRAEFIAMLVRSLGIASTGSHSFKDVGKNAWFAEAVTAASEAGIITGRGEGTFEPNKSITRQEMAVTLMNAYTFRNGDTQQSTATGSQFSDQGSVSIWAQDAVKQGNAIGLFKGNDVNQFEPQSLLTRKEAAQVIYTLLNN